MGMNNAYLERRLSGGAANTNQHASLGSDMSSERVLSQSHTSLTNVTGVTIEFAGGNPTGAGSLAYTHSGQTLTWTPNGLEPGDPVPVGAGGKFAIFGEAGELLVSVVTGSLPGSNQSDSVTIANIANEVWDDVTKQESFDGDTEYRCHYVTNTNVGTISSLTRSSSTAHATTAAAHGYTTGDEVTIRGAVENEYNGTFTITVIDTDEFEYTVTGSPATPATGTLKHGLKFMTVSCYIAQQPDPGNLSIGVDPAGRGDGTTRAVTSVTRTGSVATVTTTAPHEYQTGQTVRIAGAAQTDYNGAFTITVTGASTFTYTVPGTPVTPATGTITAARGVATTVANENTAPSGVTFSDPADLVAAVDFGSLEPGEAIAFWEKRIIPQRNTTTNLETIGKLAFATYF